MDMDMDRIALIALPTRYLMGYVGADDAEALESWFPAVFTPAVPADDLEPGDRETEPDHTGNEPEVDDQEDAAEDAGAPMLRLVLPVEFDPRGPHYLPLRVFGVTIDLGHAWAATLLTTRDPAATEYQASLVESPMARRVTGDGRVPPVVPTTTSGARRRVR